MAIRAVHHWRNVDSTQDLNRKTAVIISKGIFYGGAIVPIASALRVTINPFKAITAEGLVVYNDESEVKTIPVGNSYIVLRVTYAVGESTTHQTEILSEIAYQTDVDGPAGTNNLIIFAKLIGVSAPQVLIANIDYTYRDKLDVLDRKPFRGVYATNEQLPLPTNDVNVTVGDICVVARTGFTPSLFGWTGVSYVDLQSSLVGDLLAHRQNLLTNEKHLSDDQYAAAAGTFGFASAGNRYVVEHAVPYEFLTQLTHEIDIITNESKIVTRPGVTLAFADKEASKIQSYTGELTVSTTTRLLLRATHEIDIYATSIDITSVRDMRLFSGRMYRTAVGDFIEWTGGDASHTIMGNATRQISGYLSDYAFGSIIRRSGANLLDTIAGAATVSIGGSLSRSVGGSLFDTVSGNATVSIGGSYSVTVGTSVLLRAGGTVNALAGGTINLISGQDVFIDGQNTVKLSCTNAISIIASDTDVNALDDLRVISGNRAFLTADKVIVICSTEDMLILAATLDIIASKQLNFRSPIITGLALNNLDDVTVDASVITAQQLVYSRFGHWQNYQGPQNIQAYGGIASNSLVSGLNSTNANALRSSINSTSRQTCYLPIGKYYFSECTLDQNLADFGRKRLIHGEGSLVSGGVGYMFDCASVDLEFDCVTFQLTSTYVINPKEPLNGLTFRHCKFIAPAANPGVVFVYSGADRNQILCSNSIVFENCYFENVKLIDLQGNSDLPFNIVVNNSFLNGETIIAGTNRNWAIELNTCRISGTKLGNILDVRAFKTIRFNNCDIDCPSSDFWLEGADTGDFAFNTCKVNLNKIIFQGVSPVRSFVSRSSLYTNRSGVHNYIKADVGSGYWATRTKFIDNTVNSANSFSDASFLLPISSDDINTLFVPAVTKQCDHGLVYAEITNDHAISASSAWDLEFEGGFNSFMGASDIPDKIYQSLPNNPGQTRYTFMPSKTTIQQQYGRGSIKLTYYLLFDTGKLVNTTDLFYLQTRVTLSLSCNYIIGSTYTVNLPFGSLKVSGGNDWLIYSGTITLPPWFSVPGAAPDFKIVLANGVTGLTLTAQKFSWILVEGL